MEVMLMNARLAGHLGCPVAAIAILTFSAQAQLPEFRTIDGASNNLVQPVWGSAGTELLRRGPPAYADGANSPSGTTRPNPRLISNVCVAQSVSQPNSKGASDFLWQWGQFVDHDLDLTESVSPAEPFNISVPAGDLFFDPMSNSVTVINLDRSIYRMIEGVRQQLNTNTAYLDGSMVYGSDAQRASQLRTLDGTGRLKTSAGNLLPFNTNGLHNFPADGDPSFFVAGDVRANEQIGLTAMHTLFVREHNHWADYFKGEMPAADDDEIYQLARVIVGAEIQMITYAEFLPILLGANALRPYTGYKTNINAGIEIAFSTAAYRVGHTLLSPGLLRLRSDGRPIDAGNIALKDVFFSPGQILTNGGIEPLLRGLSQQRAQEVDNMVVDGVRNFLFGPPGAGGFDLPSLNIQRGRDHGLPPYNQVRTNFGLAWKSSFADISSNTNVQARLAQVYSSVEDMDLWVGGLAEDHFPGAMVGETIYTILKDQFERLRDGDRFWYENYLPPTMLNLVTNQTLAKVIRRNTSIADELQDNVFLVPLAQPFLTFHQDGHRMQLSWPGMFTDMTLQMATQLDPSDWTNVTTTGNGMTMEMESPARFFRLVKH